MLQSPTLLPSDGDADKRLPVDDDTVQVVVHLGFITHLCHPLPLGTVNIPGSFEPSSPLFGRILGFTGPSHPLPNYDVLTGQELIPRPTVAGVVTATTTAQHVTTQAAAQHIVAAATEQQIVTSPTTQPVPRANAEDGVLA